MKTAIQQLIEFINKMQNDGSGGLRVQAILDYAESLEQSHTSPMSAEQVERVTGHDLITGALPYIEESLSRPHIDKLAKYLDSYLYKVFNQLPASKPKQNICDCVIPKPIDAYHPIDKNICRDCNCKINADDASTTPSVKADGWVSVEDVERLQSEIHKITGDGEVMMLFNKLLGVSAK